MKATSVCLALIALLLVVGRAAAERIVGIDQKADGTTVALNVGDKLVVTLAANSPATKFKAWNVLGVKRTVLRHTGTSHRLRTKYGGNTRLRFTAASKGSTRLRLGYSLASGGPIEKRFSVIVAVG